MKSLDFLKLLTSSIFVHTVLINKNHLSVSGAWLQAPGFMILLSWPQFSQLQPGKIGLEGAHLSLLLQFRASPLSVLAPVASLCLVSPHSHSSPEAPRSCLLRLALPFPGLW